jgi:MFS family permease
VPAKQSRIALSLLNLLLAAVQTGFGPFVSVWLTEQHWNQTDIGIALSIGTIAALLGQLPAGLLIDATSRKRLAAGAALLVLGLSALILALWPAWLPVLSAEILHGLASCALIPAIAALTLSLVGHDAFAEQVGINARYASIGNAAAAALLGLWGTYLSQRGVLLLTAAMALPALLALFAIPRMDLAAGAAEDEHAAHMPAKLRKQREEPNWHVVYERGFVAFALCAVLFQLANAALLPLALNSYVAHETSSAWIISACIIVPQLVVAALSPWIGRVANHWGRRPILLLGFLALPARGLLIAFLPDPLLLIPVQLLDGISGAVFGLMLPLIAADVSRRIGCLNLAIGVFSLAGGLGATVSTTLAGAIADAAGMQMAFLMLAAAGGGAVLLVWGMMPETRPARRTRPARATVAA